MAHEHTRRRRRRRRVLWPYVYVLPAIGTMVFVFGYPLVQVVRDSFYAGSFDSPIWVGLDNYRGVIDDPEFRQSLLNNLKLLLVVPVMLGLALVIALVLNDGIRGMRKYQAIIFLPFVLPATAIGISFSYLLQQNGVLNTALRNAHLGAFAAGLAGQLPPCDRVGRGARRLAAARLRCRRVHGGAARPATRDLRSGAHRWRGLVEPAAAGAGAADPPDHRAAQRDPGDHRARVGVQLRLRAHVRRPRLRLERDGALHLEKLLQRRRMAPPPAWR